MYNVAFFFHIVGVLLFFTGIGVAGVAFEAARRRAQPADVALLLGLTRVGVVLVGVGGSLAGVFGLWLVHLGNWGYGSFWVDASIVAYVLVLGLGGVGGRVPRQARVLATRLAGEGSEATDDLRALLDDRASRAENYASLVLALAIVALMCFKP